jgi:hypothetical protein
MIGTWNYFVVWPVQNHERRGRDGEPPDEDAEDDPENDPEDDTNDDKEDDE